MNPIKTILVSSFLALALLCEAAPEKPGLSITETIISPRPARFVRFEGWIVVSEDCRHVAYREQNRNKWRIVRDGITGKEYDETPSLSFSPNSKKMAYIAKLGSQWRLVVDDVEGKPFAEINPIGKEEWPFVFSDDSARIAYVGVRDDKKECIVVDAVAGPIVDEILPKSFSFSSDSQHYAYAARRADKGVVVKDGQAVLEAENIYSQIEQYGDIKVGTTFGPFLSPKGDRLACAIGSDDKWSVWVDGVKSQNWESIEPLRNEEGGPGFSPDGVHFAYLAQREDKTFVVMDGKILGQGDECSGMVFSDDGKNYAFATTENKGSEENPKQKSRAWLNGVPGRTFDGVISDLKFSPDGQKLAYNVKPDDKDDSFMVIHDGLEFRDVSSSNGAEFSSDSKHMGFLGRKGDASVVVVDGKVFPKANKADEALNLDCFTFSPDGKSWAYIAQREKKAYAVVQGKDYGPYDYLCEPMAKDAYIFFSPDSRHFAFQATRGGQQYLVVDGREQGIPGEWLTGSLLRYDSSNQLHGLVMGKDHITLMEVKILE